MYLFRTATGLLIVTKITSPVARDFWTLTKKKQGVVPASLELLLDFLKPGDPPDSKLGQLSSFFFHLSLGRSVRIDRVIRIRNFFALNDNFLALNDLSVRLKN